MDVEQLAKKLFEFYGLKETGKRPDWQYLSKERQLEWIQEVHIVADALLSQLKSKIKPIVIPPGTINTSYSLGYNEALKQERTNFINLVEMLEQDVEEQISNFKNK